MVNAVGAVTRARVVLIVLLLTQVSYCIAATFSYAGNCPSGCYSSSGDRIFGVDPGLTGYIEFADDDVMANAGVSADSVSDYFFQHASGDTYSFDTGYAIDFENIGFTGDANSFEYLNQGQASHSFPIGYIYITQGSESTSVIALEFKHSASSAERVDWRLTTYNSSVSLALDSGTGLPFSSSVVPVPAGIYLVSVPLAGLGFRRKRERVEVKTFA